MTLTVIRRQDAGKYGCTADNGIGSSANRDVWIVVQCECCVKLQLQFINAYIILDKAK